MKRALRNSSSAVINMNMEKKMRKLKTTNRPAERKSQVKALRREGKIPAVIYHRSKMAEAVSVDEQEFVTLLRGVQQGRLSTTKFILESADGKTRQAIIKDIQYNPVNYDVIHLDFEELVDNIPVNVKIPIDCVGVADSVGIKLGGFLRQVIRFVRVKCLPKDIPSAFQIDVKEMVLYDNKKLKDLEIPNNVKPLANLNEVVVVIAKR